MTSPKRRRSSFPKISASAFCRSMRCSNPNLASTLYLLLASVFVLLFIACVNVSSLLLARAVSREHEFLVRASIGASRMRLVRNALTESLLLALTALPVALGCAWLGLQAILRIVPADTIPDEALVTMNIPVLLGSLALALATVLIFGLAPAWHSANPRLAAALSGSRSSGNRTQRRLLSGFVVTEIALSLALLMLAGLMVRSLIAVENVPVPFAPDRTLMMSIPLPDVRYPTPETRSLFYRQLLDRVRILPGVQHCHRRRRIPVHGHGRRTRADRQSAGRQTRCRRPSHRSRVPRSIRPKDAAGSFHRSTRSFRASA